MNIINATYNERNPFLTSPLKELQTTTDTRKLTSTSILILWGGEDIATEFYNEKPINFGGPLKKSKRDLHEEELFHKAVQLKIPIIGVCRGAQLITCLTGGKLVQHIDNHTSKNHIITTQKGHTYITNSCHHQMMVPTEENIILAWAGPTIGLDMNNTKKTYKQVPELVYFPTVRAVGVQGHIEWPSMPTTYKLYIEQHINKLLLDV